MSAVVPAVSGTTIVINRDGKCSCARADAQDIASKNDSVTKPTRFTAFPDVTYMTRAADDERRKPSATASSNKRMVEAKALAVPPTVYVFFGPATEWAGLPGLRLHRFAKFGATKGHYVQGPDCRTGASDTQRSTGWQPASLPAMPVATPWWQEVEPVVRAARDYHGVDVIILRLLDAELDQPPGGRVTYLAEVAEAVCAQPWTGVLDDQPRRHSYARPGGPAADLAWARARLVERGLRPTAPPTQVRTWNLSSLWRVPVEGQTVWLKVVPYFFAHEGALLALMAGAPVPTVLGHDGGRMLLAEIPGKDLYSAELPLLREMVNVLVELQRLWSDRVEKLLALGLPDWRAPALCAAIAEVVVRTRDEVSAEDRAMLAHFVRGLPGRFDDVAACGVRDKLDAPVVGGLSSTPCRT